MTIATEFKFRTEDIRKEDIQKLFVNTAEDRKSVDMLKSPSPVILEGSRGAGKSFLLRVAEIELDDAFPSQRVLPVYISFVKSSLIHTTDPKQFHHWMLAKVCARVLRALKSKGLVLPSTPAVSLLAGGSPTHQEPTTLETLVERYESSYKNPEALVDSSSVPDIEDFKDSVEDVCRAHDIKRICLLFDEAMLTASKDTRQLVIQIGQSDGKTSVTQSLGVKR